MAKYSKKVMGKEVGDATVYAEPHTMAGAKYDIKQVGKMKKDPNTVAARNVRNDTPVMRVSAGDPAREDVKTSGIKTRGNGCATKGTIARGPMG